MADFLSQYSIQRWLEMAPQGYLEDTVYGHDADEEEPAELLDNDLLREESIRTTVQLVVGERCALAASSGLVNCAPDFGSKTFLATQTLDEARHVEIFTQRLYDLGVNKDDLESTLDRYANPNLVKFAEILLERVQDGDFVAGVVGQNIVLEGMAFTVFELLEATSRQANPKFAHTLSGTIADERRHVGFGENRIGSLVREQPQRKADVEQMQKEMTYYMLATFADSFSGNAAAIEETRRIGQELTADAGGEPQQAEWHGADLATASPEELEDVLAGTVLDEFKTRLGRIGLEYQSPPVPA
ncbi:MAG: ferritin-like domain-containing protein [Acidimicrobiia bacterium]|nr:ferritin-like domain-containing protein [Acidimicrobiia bacterium]